MIGLVIAAPLLAALVTIGFSPLDVRRLARVVLATLAASSAFLLAGRVDTLSLLFAGIVSVLGWLATVFSTGMFTVDWGRGNAVWERKSVYFLLLGLFWSAMLLVVLSTNFALLWFGISVTTLATAFLVGFNAESTALEAAWKYLVLCSIGVGLAFLGIILLARVSIDAGIDPTQSLAWDAIAALGGRSVGTSPLARLGIAIMLLGFATKAGLVPMHAWLPDAHSKAPAPISALLSGVLVSCSLYALVRTANVAAALGVEEVARTLLLWLGSASVIVAGALMLVQRELKRFLAYSTVEHAGLVALALGFGGPLGMFAALFHVVAHAFAKSSAFFAAAIVQKERGTTSLGELRGLWRSGVGGRFLLAAMTALGGMPPFGLFVSELLIVAAGVAARQWTSLAFGIVGMMLAFAAVVRTTVEVESGQAGGVQPVSRLSLGAAAGALTCALTLVAVPWVMHVK